ncbi:MAG: hypothetical protein LUE64_03920 [Candidatus Gastranaerophilales bacterium]|nr:hypothetical protein [Candidatus Gastranaerophilales bacterium]
MVRTIYEQIKEKERQVKMGGRGSGGGRSSGGGGSSSNLSSELLTNETINKYANNNSGFISDIQEKLKTMSDSQLNKQYTLTRKEVKKATSKLREEERKLEQIGNEFENTKEGSKDYYNKMRAMNTQIRNVQIAREYANMNEQAHYIVVNERNNVRGKK